MVHGVLGEPLALPRRRPRVLAVAVRDPDGALEALARAVWRALGHVPDHPDFLPHVTVARGIVMRPVGTPEPRRVTFATLTLYRSLPGSRYEPLSVVTL